MKLKGDNYGRRTTTPLHSGSPYIASNLRGSNEPADRAAGPDFTGTGSNGETVHLADLKGKMVVLEWTNDGCPYVGKWYRSGAMQQLQLDASALGAVWLTVVSSGPGEQGYVDAAKANEDTASRNAAPAHVLLVPRGEIGHLYGAATTPHIFVIKPDGTLAYMGGADSGAASRFTRPYGCSVKYSS